MSSYVTYHWAEPDPDIVEQQLINLAQELDDFEEVFAVAEGITIDDTSQRFKTGSGPDGIAWAPWSWNYRPYALAHSTGPILGGRANLHLTGALEDSVTSPSSYLITEEGLFLDTSDLPEYWAWNNFGATRSSQGKGYTQEDINTRARQILTREFRAGNRSFGAKRAVAAAKAEFGSGKNELPQRPFIGLSPEAQAKINAIFFAWVQKEVTTAMSSTGRAFARHSKRYPKGTPGGLGGRFMPRDL